MAGSLRARVCATSSIVAAVLVSTGASGAAVARPAVQAAPTGSVSGHVQIVARPSRRLASAGAYPGRVITPARTAPVSELANVIVYVDTAATPSPPMHVAIRQTDEEFVPHTTAITAGSTVDFPNDDLVFHNVFSLSRAASFDLGHYPKGESKARTFSTPGLVKVYCHIHSHMSAMVRVFDHPFFTIPDDTGAFTIDGLAPGTYDVIAWHERVGEVKLRATVTAGHSADLAFSLPLTDDE